MAETQTSQNLNDEKCEFLHILKNKDKDPLNKVLTRVVNSIENSNYMVSSYLDDNAKKIADQISNKFLEKVFKCTPNIARKCVILWIETYLENTKFTDAGDKLDTFILTYG